MQFTSKKILQSFFFFTIEYYKNVNNTFHSHKHGPLSVILVLFIFYIIHMFYIFSFHFNFSGSFSNFLSTVFLLLYIFFVNIFISFFFIYIILVLDIFCSFNLIFIYNFILALFQLNKMIFFPILINNNNTDRVTTTKLCNSNIFNQFLLSSPHRLSF